jgi:hypothetical protein
LFAAAVIGGLALSAGPGSASPLAGGLATGPSTVPQITDGLVQKVHGWHCRKRYGWYRGHKWWHRHRRACDDYSYHPGIGLNLYFFDDDGHRHKRRKHKSY